MQKKYLVDFLKEECKKNKRYKTNWEYALSMWNDNNTDKIQVDETSEVLDYTKLKDKNYEIIDELDIFDFNNIPMSELDKAYIDYEPLYDTVDWFSVDEDYLYEERKNNTNGIQSAVDVVSRAMDQLKMSEFQIKVKSPNCVEFIDVKRLMEDYPDFLTMSTAMLVPDIKKNVEIITEFMDENGYYGAKKTIYKDKGGRIWMLLIFDSQKHESIKEMVMKYHKYAYHTSPIYNAESIEKMVFLLNM